MAETTNSKVDSPNRSIEADEEAIYFSQNFAEGKAMQRIHQPIPESDWVTVEASGEVDLDAVRQRMKQHGYKTQVSAENSSTSNQ